MDQGRVSLSQELSRVVLVEVLRGTGRNTFPNIMLRAQDSDVIPSLFELDTNKSQACVFSD